MPGKIIIDKERCKGCGLCVEVCQSKCIVISRQSNPMGYFPAQPDKNGDLCTGCAICALVCPDAAIEVWRELRRIIEVGKKAPSKVVKERT